MEDDTLLDDLEEIAERYKTPTPHAEGQSWPTWATHAGPYLEDAGLVVLTLDGDFDRRDLRLGQAIVVRDPTTRWVVVGINVPGLDHGWWEAHALPRIPRLLGGRSKTAEAVTDLARLLTDPVDSD